jgi:hypothetical protein
MSKTIHVIYNVVLLLVAAGAIFWYVRHENGPPRLQDGTQLARFAGQWPADWPADLRLVGGDGVWAGKLGPAARAPGGERTITGQFFLEQPPEEAVQDFGLLLRGRFGDVGTINLSQEGQVLEGFMVYPRAAPRAAGYESATFLVSTPAPQDLRNNPGRRIEAVLSVQCVLSRAATP